MNTKQWRVGIFLFDDVEVLDFAGPFEVNSVTELEMVKNRTGAFLLAKAEAKTGTIDLMKIAILRV